MNAWFNGLQDRERYLVVGGAVTLLLLLVYLLLWEPAVSGREKLQKSVVAQRSQLLWMNNASAEVQALQKNSSAGHSSNLRMSLIRAVESSASRTGLRSSVTRMEPQGAKKITVELKQASFDRLVEWIGLLQRDYGASIQQFSASKTDAKGLVDARFILARGAS
ncbi:MAG TPA: type II secretion system protein M [Gammaproteobacteria bacterium]|nr:type II secretion system protein M [Gammaproteobacteria bacterium]